MAHILTPRFAQAYLAPECNPFGFCASPSRPTYGYRTAQRPQSRPSPFASFFGQLGDLVSEIDRECQLQAQLEAQREAQRVAQRAVQIQAQREAYEAHIEAQRAACRQRKAQIEVHIAAQREAHHQRQLRKRALRAQFAVTQHEQGWQVDAEILGFQQENINIEVIDENTLKVAGNTEWGAKPQLEAEAEIEVTHEVEQSTEEAAEQTTEQTIGESADEKMQGITVEPSVEIATKTIENESARPATPDSDTFSQKSYQATVEDDFEDLGPEASTLFSTSSAPATPSETKGKGKAAELVEDPEVSVPTEIVGTTQSQPEVPAQQQEVAQNPHGSFERTWRFPERIDADGVRASLKDGVLSITVPRVQGQQVRRITIM